MDTFDYNSVYEGWDIGITPRHNISGQQDENVMTAMYETGRVSVTVTIENDDGEIGYNVWVKESTSISEATGEFSKPTRPFPITPDGRKKTVRTWGEAVEMFINTIGELERNDSVLRYPLGASQKDITEINVSRAIKELEELQEKYHKAKWLRADTPPEPGTRNYGSVVNSDKDYHRALDEAMTKGSKSIRTYIFSQASVED